MVQTISSGDHVLGTHPDLQGKRVLVTGGSAGIGRAAALAFAQNGARVAVMGRRKERLDAVVAELPDGLAVVGDLMSLDDCTRAVEETVAAFGGLDILVNSGGAVTPDMMAKAGQVEALQASFQLHVYSVFALMKAAEAELKKNRGSVVNVSSIVTLLTADNDMMLGYYAAKSAQDQLTQSYARQWGPSGVNVNSVLPGFVNTEVTAFGTKLLQTTEEQFLKAMANRNPLKRVCTPEEQGAVIVFLASKAASFVNGASFVVDGGTVHEGSAFPTPDEIAAVS